MSYWDAYSKPYRQYRYITDPKPYHTVRELEMDRMNKDRYLQKFFSGREKAKAEAYGASARAGMSFNLNGGSTTAKDDINHRSTRLKPRDSRRKTTEILLPEELSCEKAESKAPSHTIPKTVVTTATPLDQKEDEQKTCLVGDHKQVRCIFAMSSF